MVPAWNIPDRNRRIFEYLRSELPPGAPVAAQMDLYTLVPYRRGLTTLRHAAQARYVIVDRYGRSELSPDEVDSLLTRLLSSKSHCLKHEDDGFYVFESMAHSQASP